MSIPAHHIRLFELNQQISDVVSECFSVPVWVVAEIAEIKSQGSAGHTYMDLVDKQGESIVATARATLWASGRSLLTNFERVTRRKLARGMEVLLLVKVTFHARYGFSLNVSGIDPNYTLGDMARRRQEVIQRLTDEGLIDRNKTVPLALVPQRVAIISSATAAGWQDFERRLRDNPYGYTFTVELFEAVMQGEEAQTSISRAFKKIGSRMTSFDCVVLIRGGGGTVDLSCFDGYPLSRTIAEFGLPVVCGIGHDKDQSVADLVAAFSVATPTAAAEFLVARVRGFEEQIELHLSRIVEYSIREVALCSERIGQLTVRLIVAVKKETQECQEQVNLLARQSFGVVRGLLDTHVAAITTMATKLSILPAIKVSAEVTDLASYERDLVGGATRFHEKAVADLSALERDVKSRDPQEVLRRGYSITRLGGHALANVREAVPGALVETILHSGTLFSTVEGIEVKQ